MKRWLLAMICLFVPKKTWRHKIRQLGVAPIIQKDKNDHMPQYEAMNATLESIKETLYGIGEFLASQPNANPYAIKQVFFQTKPVYFKYAALDPHGFNMVYNEIFHGEGGGYTIDHINFDGQSVVIDIGANIGMFAIYAALRFPEIKKIYAFEPLQENYALLVENIKINNLEDRIIPVHKAVYATKDTLELSYYPLFPIASTSSSMAMRRLMVHSAKKEVVDTISLDEIMDTYAIDRVKLLKIDCEGAEADILYMSKNLAKIEFLCGEFHYAPDKNNELLTYLQKYIKKEAISVRCVWNFLDTAYNYIPIDDTRFKVIIEGDWFWKGVKDGTWEPESFTLFKKYINPHKTFVDIGAFIGVTVFLAAALGVKDIYAIEANPKTFNILAQNCLLNKSTEVVHVFNQAITDKDNDTISFGASNGSEAISSASSTRGSAFKVSTITLSSFIKNNAIDNIGFIKIDIEGSELDLLTDLKTLAHATSAIVFLSIHPPFFDNPSDACVRILELYDEYDIYDTHDAVLNKQALESMITTTQKYPSWGTEYGNFFEILMKPKA